MNANWLRHPAIFQLGRIEDDGKSIKITGWGLSYCGTRCQCHKQSTTNNLVILEDPIRGELGLQKFRVCSCCVPWTHEELRGFLRDLAAIEALEAGQTS